jgi:molybdopterin-binding aldehyde dehydrogenase-like protein
MIDDIEVERYELSRPPAYQFELERRDFMRIFAALGGGLMVASIPETAGAQESGRGGQQSASADLAAWIHIGEDGRITGYTGKTEIGQNIRTSLAQAIADELKVPLTGVSLVMADTDLVPFDQGTFGSLSTPRMAPVLARAAATAREMLIDRAAALWNVERGGLSCRDSRITGQGRSAGFGELVKGRKLTGVVPAEAAIAPPASWTLRGTAPRKVDGRSFVTGQHRYTPDVTRPGMMYGRVIRSDGYTGTLLSFDDSAARALPGVVVVRDADFAGVVAPTERLARRAAALILPEWRMPQDRIGRGRSGYRSIAGRRRRRRTKCGSPHVRRDLPHSLHRARAARAPLGGRRMDRRQADRVDRHAAPVWCARRARDGLQDSRGSRARDRARHRLRVWGQAHR